VRFMQELRQKLPGYGPQREALREKGQFWTPAWVAEAMVGYVLHGDTNHIFDPAVGAGAFLRAAKVVSQEMDRQIGLRGMEIDPDALKQCAANGLSIDDLAGVQLGNFVLQAPAATYRAIVANPPYIRHHRLAKEVKAALRAFGMLLTGVALDGRAGLHIYFMLRALQALEVGGRLAFIMPADTCEGTFAPALWSWITARYRLEAVVTFAPEAAPFPNVDTNALIFLIQNAPPIPDFVWARCTGSGIHHLKAWIAAGLAVSSSSAIQIHRRSLAEGLSTGLSRPPTTQQKTGLTLLDFATVTRGIATGANDFFFLTQKQAEQHRIPRHFLRLAIGRTRDVDSPEITAATMRELDIEGRPTRLLSLDKQPLQALPPAVQAYLTEGERRGLAARPLISQRRPWYKMEARAVPPLLFAYLGRRNARFIKNTAGVLPLTCFLCVYPKRSDPASVAQLWQILQHPDTVANLALVGKSYGSGAIKVEPRGLERLPIPQSALEAAGMPSLQIPQPLPLFD
jgi:adenine-specific DNA-methyltransferase